MKKIKQLCISLIVILLVCGCNSNSQSNKYIFNESISIGEVFSENSIGKANSYSEIPSCAFEGTDKVYTYDHYEITTYSDGSKEKIYSIYFIDSEVSTNEDVKISDSIDKMIETYGECNDINGNLYSYTKGNTILKFIVNNDKIISIEYVLNN